MDLDIYRLNSSDTIFTRISWRVNSQSSWTIRAVTLMLPRTVKITSGTIRFNKFGRSIAVMPVVSNHAIPQMQHRL